MLLRRQLRAGRHVHARRAPSIKATTRAFYDSFLYAVTEDGSAARAAQRAGARYSSGEGATLTLRKAPSARSADLEPGDNQQEVDFQTTNSADFAAYGARVKGAAGATVEATVGFRNRGPAWVGYIRSGEDVATVDITVPAGATVVDQPESCRGVTADGEYRENQKAAPRYFCSTPMSVREDADFALPFELKIDKVVAGASGKVLVRNTHLAAPGLPFDPKPANNTASLVLNAEDSGSGGTGSTTSGSGGSTATGGSTGVPRAAAAAARPATPAVRPARSRPTPPAATAPPAAVTPGAISPPPVPPR